MVYNLVNEMIGLNGLNPKMSVIAMVITVISKKSQILIVSQLIGLSLLSSAGSLSVLPADL